MRQEPKAGRRIVSRGAYIWAVAKRVGVVVAGATAFIGFFAGVVFLVIRTLQYGRLYEGRGVVALVCCLVVIGLFFNCDAWFHSILKKAESIDTGVPLTRANTADLPAPDSLVRASQEPAQAQEDVLLRAASGEAQAGQEGQLLRATQE